MAAALGPPLLHSVPLLSTYGSEVAQQKDPETKYMSLYASRGGWTRSRALKKGCVSQCKFPIIIKSMKA